MLEVPTESIDTGWRDRWVRLFPRQLAVGVGLQERGVLAERRWIDLPTFALRARSFERLWGPTMSRGFDLLSGRPTSFYPKNPGRIGLQALKDGGRYGGAEEDRTPDLRIANATLSQLSYRPS